jgi:hypothetical protein
MYFYFPYTDEGFFWTDPQIINTLFSYRKGWLVYSPLIVAALGGIFLIKKDFPLPKWIFLFVLTVMTYVYSCWWDWGFGGSFGARQYVQHIAYLSFPLGFIIQQILNVSKAVLRPLVMTMALIFFISCILLNISQTYQYGVMGVLHYSGMSKKLYWEIFRTYQYNADFNKLYPQYLEEPNAKKMVKGIERSTSGFVPVPLDTSILNVPPPPHSELYFKRLYETSEFIKLDKKWLEQTKKKAKQNGVSLEEQIKKEAEWVLGMEGIY